MTKKSNLQNLFLIFLASILFILANPNFLINKGLGFLAWFYYFPVLIVVKKSSMKEVLLYGFLYGFLSYAGYSFWLLNSYKAAFFFIIFGYGLCFSLEFLFLKIAEKLYPSNHFIVQWLILCSFEYIKTLGFLGLNYGVTGYTQYNYKTIIQISDLTGPFGLNLLIILFSCVIFSLSEKIVQKKKFLYNCEDAAESGIIQFNKSEQRKKSASMTVNVFFLILWTAGFLLTFVYGNIKINSKSEYKTIKVCAVQNNEDPWKNGINVYSENVRNLMNITTEALELNPDIKLVVWPETSVVPDIVSNYTSKKDQKRYEMVANLLSYLNKWNCVFVVGNGHEVLERGSKKDYNSALIFTPKKNVLPPQPEIYSKIHLVPFAESFPLKEKFPEIYTFLVKHGSQMWENGDEYKVFQSDDGAFVFSTPVCFEDTFTKTGREMYKAGARCFVNLTNDSWAASSVCQHQHLAMAIFRCVENRVPAVRSTTSGVTCIINTKGKITKQLDEFEEACLIGDIELIDKNQPETFYTKYGDFCGTLTVAAAVLLLIIKIFIVIINKYRK